MRRRLRKHTSRRSRKRHSITPCNHRDFRWVPVEAPELRWVDQILRSFNEETPPEWLPAQYQRILH